MGWTFTKHTEKSKLILKLTSPKRYISGDYAIAEKYSLGCHDKDVLWVVWKKNSGERFIVCYLLSNQNGWGYKDMSEDMFPYYYDCPDDLIELVPPIASNIFNLEWRETRLKYFGDRK